MSLYTDRSIDAEHIGGNRFRLSASVVWMIGHEHGPSYIVRPGFEFDVSVPWFLRWLFNPRCPQYLKSACLHDHMLQAGWDRMSAGSQFHQALKADGVAAWRRIVMWLAVSLWKYEI